MSICVCLPDVRYSVVIMGIMGIFDLVVELFALGAALYPFDHSNEVHAITGITLQTELPLQHQHLPHLRRRASRRVGVSPRDRSHRVPERVRRAVRQTLSNCPHPDGTLPHLPMRPRTL